MMVRTAKQKKKDSIELILIFFQTSMFISTIQKVALHILAAKHAAEHPRSAPGQQNATHFEHIGTSVVARLKATNELAKLNLRRTTTTHVNNPIFFFFFFSVMNDKPLHDRSCQASIRAARPSRCSAAPCSCTPSSHRLGDEGTPPSAKGIAASKTTSMHIYKDKELKKK
jgi:hypothetical protein